MEKHLAQKYRVAVPTIGKVHDDFGTRTMAGSSFGFDVESRIAAYLGDLLSQAGQENGIDYRPLPSVVLQLLA